jgi:hypothetical protein
MTSEFLNPTSVRRRSGRRPSCVGPTLVIPLVMLPGATPPVRTRLNSQPGRPEQPERPASGPVGRVLRLEIGRSRFESISCTGALASLDRRPPSASRTNGTKPSGAICGHQHLRGLDDRRDGHTLGELTETLARIAHFCICSSRPRRWSLRFGLWLLPLGYLIIKSGYFPTVLWAPEPAP